MGIVKSSVFQLEAPDDLEPLNNWAAIQRRNSATMDAAMAQRVTPPGIPDLNAEIAARQAADATLQAALDALPRGRKGSVKTSALGPDGVAAVETMFDPVTFTAQAGRRYKFTYDGMWVSNTAQSTAVFRMRWAAGSSVTSAGSLLVENYIRAWAFGEFIHDPFIVSDVTGIPAGQVTVAMSVTRGAGTGTITIPANVSRSLLVEDIGPA